MAIHGLAVDAPEEFAWMDSEEETEDGACKPIGLIS